MVGACVVAETNPEFPKLVGVVRQVLQDEKDLQEIVQLVGKVSICFAPVVSMVSGV